MYAAAQRIHPARGMIRLWLPLPDPASPPMPTTPTPRPRHSGKSIAAAMLLALVVLMALWDWNWLKPLFEARASAALNRDVRIGSLDVVLGKPTRIVFDALVIANPPEMVEPTMVTVDRLSLQVDPWPLFRGRVVLPEMAIDRPRGDLATDASGKGNWEFILPVADPEEAWSLDIGTLSINDGSIHITDLQHQSDVQVLLHTEKATADEQAQVVVTAKGTYAGQPITASLVGAAVLGLRDPSDPYKVTFAADNGPTRIAMHGTLIDPLHFGGANVTLELRGSDLSGLYPLTGIPLPPSPPYQFKGTLDYRENKIRFTDFTGTIGSSDLAGEVFYEPHPRDRGSRPIVTANLGSQKIVLADLAGFIGGSPGKADAPNETTGQKIKRDKQEAKPTVLPDLPINLPKLRAVDFHISYKGERIETEKTPLDDILAVLDIVDGQVTLDPLSFGVGSGHIEMNVALDGREDLVHASADVKFQKVDLGRIMQEIRLFKGAGTIGGRGRIGSSGNSLKTMLGRGDGELQLFMTGGDLTAILVDLAGIDIGNAVLSLLGVPRRTDLRCMIADLELKNGQVETRTFLVDTTEANVIGSGRVNLTDETIDYKLKTEPKHTNVGWLRAPIRITGPLKSPQVAPEARPLAIRGAAAVALGVLLTPLAALLPTIQLGLGEDNDCVAMLRAVGAPPLPPPPSTKGKGHRARKQDAKG